jgi:S1-C subfamily serine protease
LVLLVVPSAPRPRTGAFGIALVLASALLLGACTNSKHVNTVPTAGQRASGGTAALPSPSPLVSTAVSQDPLVEVIKRVAPAVVNVTTSIVKADPFGGAQEGKGVGTGFLIRSDGVIVTNFHVVEGAVNIKVTFPPPNQKTYTARVVGGDSEHDLAVLKIDAKDLPALALGESKSLQLGQRVIAIGYALALEGGPTVTSGIISSLARTVQAQDPNGPTRTYADVLQTDAAINPGNSGGPLVDMAGNVIGINTAGAGSAENIGFSIAIDAAKPIIDQAIAHPNAPVAYMGVTTETVDPGVAAQLDLPVDRGALVISATGPAGQAGIRQGAVIVSLDGQTVSSSEDLGKLIFAKKPGDTVRVGLVDPGGQRRTVLVTLGVRPLPTP